MGCASDPVNALGDEGNNDNGNINVDMIGNDGKYTTLLTKGIICR
ncbi:MAG: hypothetical protein R2680_11220 [Nitrososphaeraceae archaeon]